MIGLENYYKLAYDPQRQERYDDIWVIMQYAPRDRPKNFNHVMALSPSRDLYRNYMMLKEQGNWNLEVFKEMYVPRFITDLMTNETAMSQLELLVELARSGRNIALVCTCGREDMCHRSIVGGIIQGMCPDIQVDSTHDYSMYWHLLKAM